MPLLRQASSVAIVQITGEKDLSKAADPAEAVRNLKLHGIAAEVVAVELEERDAATTLQAYCERDGRELLVMGAFGHSRAREFVLGGGGDRLREVALEQRARQHARSEEHTSELQSLMRISYAVFCLKKKKIQKQILVNFYYLNSI